MWGCSHGSWQWYERAGCDIVHIAEWEWPWRMITGQCGECLVRCHDASDSSDTGWLCNTSEAGHSLGPGQWRLNTEHWSQTSVSEQANFPNIFLPPTTNSVMIRARSPESCCHHLLWSSTGWSGAGWMTSSLVLNMMSGEAEVISHPASEIISWSYWVLDSDCLGGIIPSDHD